LSRCQRFDLRRITARDIAEHLGKIARLERINLAPRAAMAIAKAAEGGMRDAESMLDQLVAFCGENIEEADVLGIFGLTSLEIVAGLAGEVFGQDNALALGSVRAYADEGKDLMKLLGDLLGYFRNLLILKTSPSSLEEEEFGAELIDVMRRQAALVQVEQLLALIELFAEAEGRMKWAPNKRLHFEIAVIKAIHQLSQTSLADIVGALTALSRGESAPSEALAEAAAARPEVIKPAPPPARTRPVETPLRAPVEPSPNPSPDAVPEPKPAPKPAPTPAPVAPTPVPAPAPVAPTPAPAPEPVPAPVPPSKLEFGDRKTKALFETLPASAEDNTLDMFGGGTSSAQARDLEPKFDLGYDNPDQEMLFDLGGPAETTPEPEPEPPAPTSPEPIPAPEKAPEIAPADDPDEDLSPPGPAVVEQDDDTPPWEDAPPEVNPQVEPVEPAAKSPRPTAEPDLPSYPEEEEFSSSRRPDSVAAFEASVEVVRPPAPASSADSEAERLWKAVKLEIKGVMLRPSIMAGVPRVFDGKELEVAFRTDSDSGLHYDSVWRKREEVEVILTSTAGFPVKLKLTRRDDLPAVVIEVAPPTPAAAPSSSAPAKPGAPVDRNEAEILEEFRNDPLIRKALDVFRGELDGIEYPAKA
jgi:hypothetical protein